MKTLCTAFSKTQLKDGTNTDGKSTGGVRIPKEKSCAGVKLLEKNSAEASTKNRVTGLWKENASQYRLLSTLRFLKLDTNVCLL